MELLSVERGHTLTVIKLFQSDADDELLEAAGERAECWDLRESWW